MKRHARNIINGQGFTLVELMVVVAIIAILAAIAVPSYTRYIVKSHRTAAEACLAQYANYMERFYATNLRYDQNSDGAAVVLPDMNCAGTANTGEYYQYSLQQAKASSYIVQAIPQGSQATRDNCGTLTLDQLGQRTVSGGPDVATCWK